MVDKKGFMIVSDIEQKSVAAAITDGEQVIVQLMGIGGECMQMVEDMAFSTICTVYDNEGEDKARETLSMFVDKLVKRVLLEHTKRSAEKHFGVVIGKEAMEQMRDEGILDGVAEIILEEVMEEENDESEDSKGVEE